MSSTAGTARSTQQQSMIDAAQASVIAYGDKNWDAVRASLTEDALYDEVGTQRTIHGIDEVITCWQGWASALPDSKATIHSATNSGNMVVLEMTWRGTHTQPLETPTGSIPASNKPIEVRACQVFEMEEGKARVIRHYFDMGTLLQQIGAM